jgi:hypothetical protein
MGKAAVRMLRKVVNLFKEAVFTKILAHQKEDQPYQWVI